MTITHDSDFPLRSTHNFSCGDCEHEEPLETVSTVLGRMRVSAELLRILKAAEAARMCQCLDGPTTEVVGILGGGSDHEGRPKGRDSDCLEIHKCITRSFER